MDDLAFCSSDEEDIEVEEEKQNPPRETPPARPTDPTAPPTSQKRTHESSSDSDKETPPSAQISLQVVPVQPAPNGWVTISKKKGKKCRLGDSTHSGSTP